MKGEFVDRNCLITGGSGLIGTELALTLAKWGANVFVLDKVTNSYLNNSSVHFVQTDFANLAILEETLQRLISENIFQHLFNCVSSKAHVNNGFYDDFSSYDYNVWNDVIEINLTSVAKVCSVVGKKMVDSAFGSIVNFGSIYGASMGADQRIYSGLEARERFNTPAAYSVSKGGLIALTRHLACLWGPYNVRTNAISPGGVYNNQPISFVNSYSKRVPLARMASLKEVVEPAIFLASDAGSYINGVELFVDGGLHAW